MSTPNDPRSEFLISLRTGAAGARELAAELEADSVPTRIPTVVIQELYVGVGEDATEDVRAYEALVANKPVVDRDDNIARWAGILEGHHPTDDAKPTLGPGDAIVAATGLVCNEPVVTNDGDFESVDGLAVEQY